jgi:hypothetical protein
MDLLNPRLKRNGSKAQLHTEDQMRIAATSAKRITQLPPIHFGAQVR